jgi:hypothetical protein
MPNAAGHYLPEFYLKGFTERKGLLWVHEKHLAPRASTPKHEANKPDFYAITSKELDPDALEKMYAKTETVVARPISKSRNLQFTMTDEDAGNIRAFAGLSFTRVPHFIDFVSSTQVDLAKKLLRRSASDAKKFYETAREVEQRTGVKLNVEETPQLLLQGNYDLLHKSNNFALASMLQTTQTIMNILVSEFEHDLLYAPEESAFITTDSPVMTLIDYRNGEAGFGFGFAHPDTEVFYPLNKRVVIHLRRGALRRKIQISSSRVDSINRALMAWGQQFMYASSGHRRLGRLFSQHAGAVKFGKTALLPPASNGELSA